MKTLFISLISLLSITSFSQDLSFSDLGSYSAYCRLFGYQNGHGSVYASATGGTPDYTYSWEELATGETFLGTTWSNLNPGMYEITVTDGIGDVIMETIEVDSVNPMASFDVISADLSPIAEGYEGVAPIEVTFVNTSEGFANPIDPLADTIFYFQRSELDDWQFYETYPAIETHEYLYSGNNEISLIAINGNDCVDTATTKIILTGPSGINENHSDAFISVTTHSINKSVIIKKVGITENLNLEIYSISGKLIRTANLIGTETELQLNLPRGVYVYSIINLSSGALQSNGKFTL